MPEPHTVLHAYAEELVATPRAHIALELRQDDEGMEITHQGQALLRCRLTRQGMAAASFVAKALGVPIPPLGEVVKARVSTGVLFRATSIASLDLDVEESFVLLERWLQEAALQRTGSSDNV